MPVTWRQPHTEQPHCSGKYVLLLEAPGRGVYRRCVEGRSFAISTCGRSSRADFWSVELLVQPAGHLLVCQYFTSVLRHQPAACSKEWLLSILKGMHYEQSYAEPSQQRAVATFACGLPFPSRMCRCGAGLLCSWDAGCLCYHTPTWCLCCHTPTWAHRNSDLHKHEVQASAKSCTSPHKLRWQNLHRQPNSFRSIPSSTTFV